MTASLLKSLINILADLNAVVLIVSTFPLISLSSYLFQSFGDCFKRPSHNWYQLSPSSSIVFLVLKQGQGLSFPFLLILLCGPGRQIQQVFSFFYYH